MTTLAVRATTQATTGTTWANLANAVDGTVGVNNATYATMTSTTSGAVATIELSGFNFAASIASTDTLDLVQFTFRHLENNTGRFASVACQAFDGATAIGSSNNATLSTSAATVGPSTIPCTLAQLRSSTFKVRITITGAASTQSRVFSIDYVDVTALYTIAPPAITQAAYRFYADGTEAGVAVADSYSEVNSDGLDLVSDPASGGFGQSFTGNGRALTQAGFRLTKIGSPSGNLTAYLYAHTGVFGTSSLATGSPLATSTARAASTVAASVAWFDFDFDGSYTLVNGTNYVIIVRKDAATTSSNSVAFDDDTSSPTHPGNHVWHDGVNGFFAINSKDTIFRVYTLGALAAQDTGYTADTSGGDVNLQVRTRLQSTTAIAVPATDDWQLQWEKNTSGTWTEPQISLTNLVPNPSLEVNTTGWAAGTNTTIARDSTNGGAITGSGSWALAVTSVAAGSVTTQSVINNVSVLPSTTYSASAYVWGTAGVNARTNTFNVSYYTAGSIFISTSSDSSVLGNGAWQRVSVTSTTPSNAAFIRFNFTQPAAAGGEQFWVDAVMLTAGSTLRSYFDGSTAGASWSGTAHGSTSSILVASGTVNAYASANLTDGAATTNRLGAGTGSFVAGKISETGLVTDLGWTANNYTELLYSVTLKQADLTPTDTVRFRVLRNAATTGMTYTQVPTITIGTAGPTDVTGTATGSVSLSGTASGVPGVTGVATGSLTVSGAASGVGLTPGADVVGTATGQIALSGVASGVPGVVATATGAVAVSGTASGQKTVGATATGSLSIVGVATGAVDVTATATAALAVAGTASGVRDTTATATGSLSLSGTATGSVSGNIVGTATGQLTLNGTASGVRSVSATATGQVTLAGTVTGLRAVGGTATGSLTITGPTVGVRAVTGTATGGLAVAGSATGQKSITATVTGSFTITGVATGVRTVTATATGSLSVTGVAAGVPGVVAAATGSLALSGTAAGVPGVIGVASAAVALDGTASAVKTVTATATGQVVFSSTALGLVEGNAVGTATGSLTVAATAVGVRGRPGAATGTLTISGIGVGVRGRPGSATGQLSLTSGAVGVRGVTATAAGVLTVVALAVAARTVHGVATGQISISGVAVGAGASGFVGFQLWDGVTFVDGEVQLWTGAAFVGAEGVKVWNGTAFVDSI